ncbi:ATP-grasp domain-containing protein [Mycobacterium sp. 1274761.0]|uniref:ATP-grasp domain-containing protein n=1 Tax=Mycobacterium sp. 1274761.0 TaxID=1834077 RepID=UPI0007FC226B|nr:ATP-grasp domain-containing protein [Mycobacterium sp. 1274761.0]OBK74564.1 carboxylate--amine ligase [Mycobacterium sp. 1274761.0]
MTEHVLVVGSGRDLPARVRRALAGTETSVICRLEFLAKLRAVTEHTRVIAVRNDAPHEEWVALARAAHEVHPFTRIATFGETDQDRCAVIGEALGIATHSPRTVELVHNKDAMRAVLRETGVDTTASAVVTDLSDLTAFVDEYGFPCVVKPAAGAGSAGVAVVRHSAELTAAFERASTRFDELPDAGVLVEQFHDGPQFSVEAFSELGEHQIVSVTRKFSDPASFVEIGHVASAELSPEQLDDVRDHVERVLTVLGVEFGATHTEIVLTTAGPRVIETHVRMGGDEIPALTFDATGVDLAEFVARQTVGEKVLPDLRAALAADRPACASAIWFVAAPASGVLADIRGLDAARSTEGVTEVEVLVGPGSPVGALESSDSRVAYVRALGQTPEQAVAAARNGVSQLVFQFEMHATSDSVV